MRTADDLQPWAARALDAAYATEGKRREKCSREDFTAGWMAALEWLRSASSFRGETAKPTPRGLAGGKE